MLTITVDGQTQTTIGPAYFPPNSSMDLTSRGWKVTTQTSTTHNISAHVEIMNDKGNVIGSGTDSHQFNKLTPGDPEEEEI
jgi:hypothetical protein